MSIFRGVDGVNREIKKIYRGIGGVNREIKEIYRSVDNRNQKVFDGNKLKFTDEFFKIERVEAKGASLDVDWNSSNQTLKVSFYRSNNMPGQREAFVVIGSKNRIDIGNSVSIRYIIKYKNESGEYYGTYDGFLDGSWWLRRDQTAITKELYMNYDSGSPAMSSASLGPAVDTIPVGEYELGVGFRLRGFGTFELTVILIEIQ